MGIVMIGLITAGILVIWHSHEIYEDSMEMARSQLSGNSATLVALSYMLVKEGYAQALFYFTIALGLLILMLLLPRIQNVSISPTGGFTLLLTQLKEEVGGLKQQANSLQATSVGEGGMLTGQEAEGPVASGVEPRSTPGLRFSDDPQKGKWGRHPEHNGRRLSALVRPSADPSYYRVELVVESTDPARPLVGLVRFHLHHTFRNPNPVIAVEKGKAVLRLYKVWGAFTAGAETDEGATRLEIDLATLEDAPARFRLL
jgi:hypothetical protein